MTVQEKILKENEQIRQFGVDLYMICIENYFQDCHNYQFLHALIICLCKYKPIVSRDILRLFCSMFDVKWEDETWRQERLKMHQKRIEKLKESEEGQGEEQKGEQKIARECKTQMNWYYESLSELEREWQADEIQAILEQEGELEKVVDRIAGQVEDMGCSYQKIADLCGISLSKIKKIFSSEKPKSIKTEDLLAFAKAFDCSVQYLLGKAKEATDIRIDAYDEIEQNHFAAQFTGIGYEVQELVRFLLSCRNREIIERLFIVTTILEEKDAQDFKALFLYLSKLFHEVRIVHYENQEFYIRD